MLLTEAGWAAVAVAVILLIVAIFGITRSSKVSKVFSTVIILGLIVGLIAGGTLLYLHPEDTQNIIGGYVTLVNNDPVFSHVDVTVPSSVKPIRVDYQASISGIPLNLLQKVTATGYDSDGNLYDMSYTYTSPSTVTLYFTVGGVFSSQGYMSIEVTNDSDDDVVLYTSVQGDVVQYYTAPTGSSTLYVFVGQSLFNEDGSSGVVIINSSITSLNIDSDGQLSVLDNIPSGNITLKNESSEDGYLYHNDPWEYDDSFESANSIEIKAGDSDSDVLVYLTQEWKMMNKDKSKSSDIYSVSQADMDGNITVSFNFN